MSENRIITNLDSVLREYVYKAKEINIAVAMASDYALDVLSEAKNGTKVKLAIGVNLPTSIDVLKALRNSYDDNARIFYKEFYHPKVYLFTLNDGSYHCYVGSANFTKGGLNNNIELSYEIANSDECLAIKDWFDDIFNQSTPITNSFLRNYKSYVTKWQKRQKERQQELGDITDYQAKLEANTDELLNRLRAIRQDDNLYKDICKRQSKIIRELKIVLDYDNDFINIDLDGFYSIMELGHIDRRYKNLLQKAISDGKLRKVFHDLCNDNKTEEQRFKYGMLDNKIKGCGKNIITKVMVIHDPKNCLLWNQPITDFMNDCDICFERGTEIYKQYSELCKYFKKICTELDIRDFAVLDAIMLRA